MYACSSLLKILTKNLIFIFINIFMILCEGKNNFLSPIDKNYCPFIETLSFGSDIHIKCNNSYLVFNEINNKVLNWKFSDQTSICNQKKTQQASINQCGISRIDSNYLKVPFKSLKHEEACVYCRINYKPIAPLITVTQSNDGQFIFNITATGLAYNEAFEILWSKRVHAVFQQSYNHWFLQQCIEPIVTILVNTTHTIMFTVDDGAINRVEFIIRRCNGTCRKYNKCSEEELKEIDRSYFQTPDSIEKISCDSHCLNGFTTPSVTHRPSHTVSLTSPTTTNTSFNSELKLTLIIVVILIGMLLIIVSGIFIRCIFCKKKGKKPVYSKTSNVDPDEHK